MKEKKDQPPFNLRFITCNYMPLGGRFESMIRKQSSTNPKITPHSIGHGYGNSSLQEVLNPSLVRLKNNTEVSIDGVGFQGIGGASATDSRVEDGEKIDAGQKFGESTKNVVTGSNSNGDKKNILAPTVVTVDYINNIKFHVEEESSDFDFESSKLDLTLKLYGSSELDLTLKL
ncbi:hypothetical protein MtrunA17_Chr7g0224061 [Medicago truncatula]|uniref:Zinc finger-like protein, putative n=1 Tax=Medicago truncatula TaxID=3880 RepID=G7L121_MEDTR|nr:zinc finger-like protein, putative [Medicago truncatula]RHN44869.1 hypothetical protein MtrunA17_Chr7g0224061 [Medicago truncatula]